MFELVLIPFLIIVVLAVFRMRHFMARTKVEDNRWEEEHFNKQLEALKKASQKKEASPD